MVRAKLIRQYRLSVLFVALSFLPAGLKAESLDPTTGNIGGRIAFAALPSDPQPANHAPCEVHLVLTSYDAEELISPCNTWFQPPVGRYLFWLEQGPYVSYQSVMFYAGEPFHQSGMLLSKPLFPAGTLEIDHNPIPPGATFRVLSLQIERNYRPFDRVIKPGSRTHTLRVPAGRVIAGVFDAAGNALSLSRPVVVEQGRTASVAFDPRVTTTLLVILDRFVGHPPLPSCEASLTIEGRVHPGPAIDLQAHDRVVLVWYDIKTGDAQFDFRCGSDQTLNRALQLPSDKVTTIRTRLKTTTPAFRPASG